MGLGSASLYVRDPVAYVRARVAGFWDCGSGDGSVVHMWGGLCV